MIKNWQLVTHIPDVQRRPRSILDQRLILIGQWIWLSIVNTSTEKFLLESLSYSSIDTWLQIQMFIIVFHFSYRGCSQSYRGAKNSKILRFLFLNSRFFFSYLWTILYSDTFLPGNPLPVQLHVTLTVLTSYRLNFKISDLLNVGEVFWSEQHFHNITSLLTSLVHRVSNFLLTYQRVPRQCNRGQTFEVRWKPD